MAHPDHAALMDGVYRRQRHIYDATRKFFLFGRDRLIADLAPPDGGAVLEVGCGTGRNLIVAARRWPQARFYGFDISAAMLETAQASVARAGLSDRITLAQADATDFDPQALFGLDRFERVAFSYTLSMIPDWRAALRAGGGCVAPGGALMAVDFGLMGAWPGPARALMRRWLNLFHVAPRGDLQEGAAAAADQTGLGAPAVTPLWGDYARLLRCDRRAE